MTLREYIERKGVDRKLLAYVSTTLPALLAEMPVGATVTADDVQIGDNEMIIDSFRVGGDATATVLCYGRLLEEVLEHAEWRPKMLTEVAHSCLSGGYENIETVNIEMEKRTARPLFVILIAVLVGALALLAWLCVRA